MINLEKYREEFENGLNKLDTLSNADCVRLIGISGMHCSAECKSCVKKFTDWLLEDDSQDNKNTQDSHSIELQSKQKVLVRNEDNENWVEGYFICYFDNLYWCKHSKNDNNVAYGWKQAALVL